MPEYVFANKRSCFIAAPFNSESSLYGLVEYSNENYAKKEKTEAYQHKEADGTVISALSTAHPKQENEEYHNGKGQHGYI